jgi:prolyl 4-hydroxylase
VQRLIDPIDGTADDNITTDDNGGHSKYGEMTNYTVTVHSRPNPDSNDDNKERDTWTTARKRRMSNNNNNDEDDDDDEDNDDTKTKPWVITFDNFLTPDECKHLINLGSDYERSEDVGDLRPDGTFDSVKSDTRTSENAWCSHKNNCRSDPVVMSIHDRIARVTGIPAVNSEDLQLLKYEKGQFYRQHHDYIEFQRDRRCGPRILTFFLYLSDVEEGGGTHFPILNITVYPKVGRALLWPSILDESPLDKDPVTDHEAQDVIKGLKFGANAWLHTYDYMDASQLGCT